MSFLRMNSNKQYHLSFPCASHCWWSKSWPPSWIAEFTIPKFFYIFINLKTHTIHIYQKLHFMKRIVELRAVSKLSYFFLCPLYLSNVFSTAGPRMVRINLSRIWFPRFTTDKLGPEIIFFHKMFWRWWNVYFRLLANIDK